MRNPTGEVGSATRSARARARSLITHLLAQPDGPARQMVELYLVTYLASLESGREERMLLESQAHQEKFDALRDEAENLMAESLSLHERNHRLAGQLAQAESVRSKVAQHLQQVEVREVSSGPTNEELYNRIAEVVGLRPPKQGAVK